jgi:hypothetical protein
MPSIITCKIHPPIGIARIGNSPTELFIGREQPGVHVRQRVAIRTQKAASNVRPLASDCSVTIGQAMTASSCLTQGGLFVAFSLLKMLIRINAPSKANKPSQTSRFSFPTA